MSDLIRLVEPVAGDRAFVDLVVSRRDVFAGLLARAGSAHLALPTAGAPAARFFAPADLAFLAAFVDTLLPATDTPGAKAANAHLGLDALMTGWASPARRAAALATIAALRADLDRRLDASIASASPATRTAALAAFDANGKIGCGVDHRPAFENEHFQPALDQLSPPSHWSCPSQRRWRRNRGSQSRHQRWGQRHVAGNGSPRGRRIMPPTCFTRERSDARSA